RMVTRLVAAIALIASSLALDDLIAMTSYGAIQGYESTSVDGTRVRIFKSVPFAAPPVSKRRWQVPEWPEHWEGVKDGRKYSAACMSNSTTSKSPQKWVDEDCLYLNIFAHGDCSAANKCPVIVYYHGGGMNYDSAVYFNDTAIVESLASKGVVFVIPAFRLGFTGQFTLGDLVPSNLGIHDALQALRFMKQEAAAFGGDGDAMTVLGHSFGGAMAIMLAFSPIRKLQIPIHQFIIMSPGLYSEPPEINSNLSEEMISRADCSSLSDRRALSCMMKKSGPELLAIQRAMEEETYKSGGNSLFGGITLGSPLFPYSSIPEMLEHPPNANIVIGSTTGELDSQYTPGLQTSLGSGVGVLVGAKNAAELDDLYSNLTQSGKTNQTHAPNSQSIYVAVHQTASSVMKGGNNVFLYSYDQPTHNRHTDDLSYLLGIHSFEQDENEKEIAKFYPELFINFTKFGVPSPEWKPMNTKDRHFSIAVNLTTGRMPELRDFYEKETIDFWVRAAPSIDKKITIAKKLGKVTVGLRDFTIEDESEPAKTDETYVPVVVVYASYFPSLLLLCVVFLIGLSLGRYFLGDATKQERLWILSPSDRRNGNYN
ncbi:hypothetical protein PENTCL1PPCAC_10517, partial [Pristionchus entomophagus]